MEVFASRRSPAIRHQRAATRAASDADRRPWYLGTAQWALSSSGAGDGVVLGDGSAPVAWTPATRESVDVRSDRGVAWRADLLDALDVRHRLIGYGPVNQALYIWTRTVLPNFILTVLGDRMEMAHSVEGGSPSSTTASRSTPNRSRYTTRSAGCGRNTCCAKPCRTACYPRCTRLMGQVATMKPADRAAFEGVVLLIVSTCIFLQSFGVERDLHVDHGEDPLEMAKVRPVAGCARGAGALMRRWFARAGVNGAGCPREPRRDPGSRRTGHRRRLLRRMARLAR